MSRIIGLLVICSLLASCASHRPPRFAEGVPVPRYLELAAEQAIATLHFPAGLYSLDSSDNDGYYYRALRPVVKHSFAGPATQNAGIFVSKKSDKIRGYVIWAGGRTKIGNLAHARITFRD